ncbi:MAG: sensor histidine kinase, partial [Candidatus Geothermincolia bacterium]
MNVYAIMSLVALGVNLAVGLYVLSRGPRISLNRMFFILMLSLAVWSVGEFGMRFATTASAATWGARVGSIGWCAAGGIFVVFTLALTDKRRWLRNPIAMALLFLPGVVFSILVWTTDLIFKGFTSSYWGYVEIGGALRFPSKIYVVGLFILGIVILYRFWRTSPSKHKRAGAFYVMVAAMVPLVAGLVTDVILPAMDIHMVEMPMFATTLIGPVIGYAVISRGLMSTIAGSLGGAIITKINDAVLISNSEGTIETVNPATTRLTGYSEAELVGTQIDKLFIEGRRPDVGHVPHGEAERVNWSLCASRDGEVIPVTCSASEVRQKRGRLIGSVTVVHDMREALRLLQVEHEVRVVSEQAERERDRAEVLKLSEQEVRKLSRFLEGVIENIAEPLFIQDREFRYIFVNSAYRDLTGYSRDEIIGKTDYELYWHEQADVYRSRLTHVFELGERVESPELAMINREGVPHTTRTVTAPMKNDEGAVEFVVGIIKDLTEQKKLENARLDFIRIAAHELRTPLTSLKLGFELLARETRGALNPEQQRSLDILSLSIERLSKLSKNLLDLAS